MSFEEEVLQRRKRTKSEVTYGPKPKDWKTFLLVGADNRK